MGAARILAVGDSFTAGMAATHPVLDPWTRQLNGILQSSKWQSGPGGPGIIMGVAGGAGWTNATPALSTVAAVAEGIFTYGGTWSTPSPGKGVNGLTRQTIDFATPARARYFIDADKLEFTDIGIIFGKSATGGTIQWDWTPGASDAGFIVPGSATIKGTISCNGTAASGVITRPAGLAGIKPGTSGTLQISLTDTSPIYFEGIILNNGDLTSGLGCNGVGRIGAATGDATYTAEERLVATFDNFCTFAGNSETCSHLLLAMGINDCNQDISIANFTTRITAIVERYESASSGKGTVGFLWHTLLDESLATNTPANYEDFRAATYGVIAAHATYTYMAADCDLYNNLRRSAAEVNLGEAFPMKISTDALKHPDDGGQAEIATLLAGTYLCESPY